MNCNELKNMLLESSGITEIKGNPQASAHLQNCSECRDTIAREEKLRQAFDSIACQAPPAFLAARIMQIQSEAFATVEKHKHASIIDQIREFFSIKNLSIAMAAGLTGFIAATLIFRTPAHNLPGKDADAQKIVISQEVPEPKPSDSAKNIDNVFDRSPVALAPEPSDSSEQDKIPGAVTFALRSEEHVLFEDSGFEQKSAEKTLVLAKNDETAFSSTSAGSGLLPRAAPSAPLQSRKKEMLHRELSSIDSFAAYEEEAPDSRAEMLLAVLEKFDIEVADGLIKIEELAMRGYIDAAQLKELQPPAGSAWFIETDSNSRKVLLKKKK